MTDEEMAEEFVGSKKSFWRQGRTCIESVKQAFIAGFKAGKDMAEADLATVAYMQGAERNKTKWHKIDDGDLPKEKKLYLATTMEGGLILAYYNGLHWETKYDISASGHAVDVIFAWCELPKYKENI